MNAEPNRSQEPGRLPARFEDWFAARGWRPRDHQLEIFARAQKGETTLLIAPTGGGKTLAGFLPALADLTRGVPGKGVHTLYISPLKALAVDIARNLQAPVAEMGLSVRLETRTGDTPAGRRQRQRVNPPDILLTTPEQLALLIADPYAGRYFERLNYIVLDELHALAASKRGDLLALGLARLQKLCPGARRIGLSATVADPDHLARFLASGLACEAAGIVETEGAAAPDISILTAAARVPWAGHLARHAVGDIYEALKVNRLALVFVNTRAQAELLFQELWNANEDNLPIALHHGSLAAGQRRKVEAAMSAGKLRAVVSTSTLDLGIDWGDVDLVINVGAPKGSSRLMQRIGRANHRLDTPSRALLVPANRFEVLECRAALGAVREGHQDAHVARRGGLDVLAQHILGLAVAGPISAREVTKEVTSTAPYEHLTGDDVAKVIDFVATGGYALRAYERYARLRPTDDGRLHITDPKVVQRYRMNVGTIVEEPLVKVRLASRRGRGRASGPLRGGPVLGEIEEYFIDQLVPGDTFLFAGQVLRFEGMAETDALASRTTAQAPKIPSYFGGKFPLSTYLAARVRKILADPECWRDLPPQVREWLQAQRWASVLPRADGLLIETFPRADKHYLVCYPFEGRLAHQTLGMLLTRRLERLGARPLGFVASEYALAIWSLRDLGLMADRGSLDWQMLFSEDMLGDDLEAWIFESSLMKRTFRNCAIISGLVQKRFIGQEKTGRQMTVSTNLIYDVLRAHEPDHVLMRAAWDDASTGLLDVKRLGDLLQRIKGRINHKALERVSPLAVPVMLEIGREPVYGSAQDSLLAEAADQLAEEAMRLV
ncbi:ATP-dependent, 3'-5' DNA helicase with strand annealing activity [hydrothermal vent metagenome]|uniref:ATP-dependent, 3'-5' DNA helicase with strand annealing activity n=1 Tax=hydrothermal vent metagenome TaxID=652676 RepID=A0A3B0T1Z0_9ZZZZ